MMTTLLWLLAGALFLALEAFGVPGIGFLFAGLGALLVGLMIELGILASTDIVWQLAAFFVNSSLLAVLLWKRLTRWRVARSDLPYTNMIGDAATVVGTLSSAATGEVRWSGTIMIARLESGGPLGDGTPVTITAVNGNVVTVKAG